ncbi:MAG: non-homologous end-joining DNA ligase [Actinobacteria bacterium]|nr:non-homologous end-joining DNA ligase [Actinomycetota bacterium]
MAGRTPIPLIRPMLAVKSDPFDSSEYLFEVKWDGYRAMVYLDSGVTEIRSRNLLDITGLFPELGGMHLNIKGLPALLDGELVVFSGGRPSFRELQTRGRLLDAGKIKRAAEKSPARFLAFDILYVSGRPVLEEALERRKDLLAGAVKVDSALVIPEFVRGEGLLLAEATRQKGLEGIVAKALKSPYLPGKRSPYWKKIRHTKEADLVICGYRAGKGGRKLGSLLLCAFEGGKPSFAGKVGTGFGRETEEDLIHKLDPLKIEGPSLPVPRGEEAGVAWVKPLLVCAVQYLERTADGYLRHPSFKGLRPDKGPWECPVPED